MAAREIRTTLKLDGERAFNSAISEAGRNMRVMASEMKSAAADFNLTGDQMEYLGRKSKSLNGQIEQQEKIIKALEGAVAESADAYGEASARTDGYRIKLNNARASMAKLQKELEETDREMADLGRDSGRVGRQLETGIGDAAEDVSRKFDSMVNQLSTDVSSIDSTLNIAGAVAIGGAVVEGVKGAYDAITGMVDASMEYNRSMSFLEINAQNAGHEFEKIKEYAVAVAGLTGDMDAAVEGMSNLLLTGFEADEMALAVARLSGAIIQFPDTMKFESLADSLQESIASGSAVGQYAEYLTRMGMDMEKVNEAFEGAKKKGQEAVETTALAFLSGHGAEETAEKYRNQYADQVAYFEAQAKLTDAQASLAKELTPAATAAIDMATGLMDSATSAVKEAKEFWGKYKVQREEKQKEYEEQDAETERETGYFTRLNEINEKIRMMDEAGRAMEAQALVTQRDAMISLYGSYMSEQIDADTFIENLEKIGQEGHEALTGALAGAGTLGSTAAEKSIQQAAEQAAQEYVDTVEEYVEEHQIPEVLQWDPSYPVQDVPVPEDKEFGVLNMLGISTAKAEEEGEEVGETMVDAISGAAVSTAEAAKGDFETLGSNVVTDVNNGIAAQGPVMLKTVQDLMDQLEAEVNRDIQGPTIYGPVYKGGGSGAGGTGGAGGSVTLELDGRTLGQTSAGYMSAEMGRQMARAEAYG